MKKCTIRTSFYFHLKSELLWPLYVFATKNEARIYYYDFYVCLLMKSEAKIYCYHFFAWLLQKMKQESTIATSDSKDNFTTATSFNMHVLWKLLHWIFSAKSESKYYNHSLLDGYKKWSKNLFLLLLTQMVIFNLSSWAKSTFMTSFYDRYEKWGKNLLLLLLL